MSESFSWWLAVEIVGLLSLPLCLAAFASLSDRGYALSKPFGLLLTGYLFWLLNSLHVFPNSRRSVAWIVVLIGLASAALAWSRREDLRAFLLRRWRYIVAVEGLFLLAFVVAAWLRSYVPQVTGTEKPMDFMYVNAATRADHFPPADPWLAGYRVSYYYFGYLLTAMVGKLAGVDTNVGYNLGLAITAALAAVAAFGIGYNLVAGGGNSREGSAAGSTPDPPPNPAPPRGRRAAAVVPTLAPAPPLSETGYLRAYVFGVAAAVFVVLLGNLEGALEFLAAHDLLPHSWYGFIAIKGLAPYTTDHFYPDEKNQFWWWFRASRVMPHGEITEFPNFSLVLGDLHPHVTAIPYVLLAVALALAFFRSGELLDVRFWLARPALLLWAAISLGGLAFLNAWDMPTLTVVVLGAALIRNRQPGESWLPALQRTLFFAVPLGLLMLLLYVPFYRGFSSQASGFDVVSGHTTRLIHLLIFWGPFAVLLVPFVAVRLWESRGRPFTLVDALVAALVPEVVIALWLVWAIGGEAPGNPVKDRSTGWITDVLLAAFVGAALLALWRGAEAEGEDPDRRGLAVFALLLTAVAALLVLGPEFYFVKDLFKNRMNTVFKLYYQAWLLAALASAYALYYLTRWWEAATPGAATLRAAWGGLAALVLLAALLYPIGATLARTGGFSGERSLDALDDIKKSAPDEYAAIEWLKDREGTPTIVEAPGRSYTYPGRISAATGLPTLIEWPGHESQWRGQESSKDWFGRFDEVQTLYTTTDSSLASSILGKYEVRFVYVGKSEREMFPPAGLAKFDDLMDIAFKQGSVTIYRVRPR